MKACSLSNSGYVVDQPINQNGDVPLHVGKNLGTRMPVSLPSDMNRPC